MFHLPDGLMIDKIEILQDGERRDLGRHSSKESFWFLCIVAYHQMIIQLREHGLKSLSEPLVLPCGRFPVLLIEPVWSIVSC